MNPTQSAKRPRSVTLTLWGVFLLGVWNLVRALALNQQRGLLQELGSQPDPMFRLVIALVWGIFFIVLAELLRRQRPFTRRIIPLTIAVYLAYEIGLIVFFAPASPAAQTLGLEIALGLMIVIFSYWALNKTAVNHYFIYKSIKEG